MPKLEHIPAVDRARFTTRDERRFHVVPEVTERVRFRTLDLFSDAPPMSTDLILCRNVFIYFTREQQERVVGVFHRSLVKGGYLVLGRTEKMPNEAVKAFEAISGRERIYRKL